MLVSAEHSSPAELRKQRSELGATEASGIRRQGTGEERVAQGKGNRSVSGCTQGVLGQARVQWYRLKPYVRFPRRDGSRVENGTETLEVRQY